MDDNEESDGKIVHLNLNRTKQAPKKRGNRKPPSAKKDLLSKLDEATKERVLEVGAETKSSAITAKVVIDMDQVGKKKEVSSVTTPIAESSSSSELTIDVPTPSANAPPPPKRTHNEFEFRKTQTPTAEPGEEDNLTAQMYTV